MTMKLVLVLFVLAPLALARPQVLTPASPPPALSQALPSQTPSASATDVPSSASDTTTSQYQAAAEPTASGGSGGPICMCGYTYCASVLMGMDQPWSQKQLADAYCKTPDASCANGTPSSDVKSALYLCLCDSADQEVGNKLHLLCGCDKCLVVGPDFRGRCETPCHAGSCK